MHQGGGEPVNQDSGDVWLVAAGVFHAATPRLDPVRPPRRGFYLF